MCPELQQQSLKQFDGRNMRLVDPAEGEPGRDLTEHVLEQQGLADAGQPHEQYHARTGAECAEQFAADPLVFTP